MELNFKQYKHYFELLDQLFEIERKLESIEQRNSISRNLNKMKDIFESSLFSSGTSSQLGFIYHNPIDEPYKETRLDVEATISGDSTEDLYIKEVIKPIIRCRSGASTIIARKGVVIVESLNRK